MVEPNVDDRLRVLYRGPAFEGHRPNWAAVIEAKPGRHHVSHRVPLAGKYKVVSPALRTHGRIFWSCGRCSTLGSDAVKLCHRQIEVIRSELNGPASPVVGVVLYDHQRLLAEARVT